MLPDQGPGIKLENSMNSVVKIKVICWEIKATKYAHERENAARARNGYAGDVGMMQVRGVHVQISVEGLAEAPVEEPLPYYCVIPPILYCITMELERCWRLDHLITLMICFYSRSSSVSWTS